MNIRNKQLKWGVFTSPQSGNNEFEMNIIENIDDLHLYLKAIPSLKNNPFKLVDSFMSVLNDGCVILLNNPHHIHGFPTWCIENTTGSAHPSSFNRVRLGEIITE